MTKTVSIKIIVVALMFGASFTMSVSAQEESTRFGLVHDAHTRNPVPVPPSESALQTAQAQPWLKVSEQGLILEGAVFDHDDNLLFCDGSGRRVLRVSPNRQLSTLVTLEALSPGGLAFHKDGRLFIAALDFVNGQGAILAVKPDGSDLRTIVPPQAGYMPNDLVFDAQGGFYFTDFKGTATQPQGGVYHVSPDFSTITPLLPYLAMANGIALSPDGRFLWVTEFARNLLHRIELADATTIAPFGSTVAYHFVGPAPDSMRADAEGNLYVALYGQGRVLAFNKSGLPIGQVLLSGRESGHHLASTSLAIRPGAHDLYIVTNDGTGGQGATIFHSAAFGQGLPPRSSTH